MKETLIDTYEIVFGIKEKLHYITKLFFSRRTDKQYFKTFIKSKGRLLKVVAMNNDSIHKYVLDEANTFELQLLSLFLGIFCL